MRYLFIIILLVIQLILFGAHYVVYKGIINIYSIKSTALLWWFKIILGTLSISFIIASLIGSRAYNVFTKIFYTGASIWLGLLLYLFIGSVLFLLIKAGLGNILSSQLIQICGILLFLVGTGIGIYGIYHARDIQITEINPVIKNLPESWEGKTAIWVSDIHIGQIYSSTFSGRIAETIQSLHPDIIFLGGDVFDGTAGDLEKSIIPLANIKSTHGTYFISGNHEEFSDDNSFIDLIEKSGIKVLKNESISINGIHVIGVDYRDSENKEILRETLKKLVQPEMPNILLKHSPTNLEVTESAGISFQISGHTHRAQVFPFTYITRMVYGVFEYGLHTYNDMSVYTSSGVGTWGPPLRVGTNSEIVKITF